MGKFLKILENNLWYKQFIYGTALAAISGLICWLCSWSLIVAIFWTTLVAIGRENYLAEETGSFNWRNFLFLIVPVLILYILFNH